MTRVPEPVADAADIDPDLLDRYLQAIQGGDTTEEQRLRPRLDIVQHIGEILHISLLRRNR